VVLHPGVLHIALLPPTDKFHHSNIAPFYRASGGRGGPSPAHQAAIVNRTILCAVMPGNRKSKLLQLSMRCDVLRGELKQLNSTNTVVHTQLLLLEALCSSFVLIQARLLSEADSQHQVDAELELVQPGLLEQLLSSTTPLQQPGDDPDVQRIAPRSDPLAFLNQLVASPADTTSLTALQLASWLRAAVLEGSVQLQQMQLGGSGAEAFDKQMEALWMR